MVRAADLRAHGWSLVSQALNSGRSMLFAIVAAGLVGADDFGWVAIVIGTAIALNGLLRAYCSHPLALVDNTPPGDRFLAAVRHQVLGGVGFAAVGALVAAVTGADEALLIGAVAFPFVAMHDGVRVSAINLGDGRLAAMADALWVGLLAAGLGVAAMSDVADPSPLVAIWGGSAAVASVGALTIHRRRHENAAAAVSVREFERSFGRRGRHLSMQLLLETIPVRILPLVVTAIIAVREAGALRGAETLLGVATVVWSAVALSVLRQARARARAQSDLATLRFVALTMSVPLVVVVANTGLVLLLGDGLGERILGDTWAGARSLLPAVATLLAAQVVLGVVATALRALDRDPEVQLMLALAAVAAVVVVPLSAMWGGADAALFADAVCLTAAALVGALRLVGRSASAEAGDHDHEDRPARTR